MCVVSRLCACEEGRSSKCCRTRGVLAALAACALTLAGCSADVPKGPLTDGQVGRAQQALTNANSNSGAIILALLAFKLKLIEPGLPPESASDWSLTYGDFDGDGVEDAVAQVASSEPRTQQYRGANGAIYTEVQTQRPYLILGQPGEALPLPPYHEASQQLLNEDGEDELLQFEENLGLVIDPDLRLPTGVRALALPGEELRIELPAADVAEVESQDVDSDGRQEFVVNQAEQSTAVFVDARSKRLTAARLPLAVGASIGSYQTGNGGQATYTMPLATPGGTGGIEPQLALNYSSDGDQNNGYLGVAWGLGGLSAITRCSATLAQDGLIDGVDFDGNDRYCLDGQRLVAVNGAYGADGTEYRTEVDTFMRVRSLGQVGIGPARFEVYSKDGRILRYGETPDSRVEAQGRQDVLTWALSRMEDRSGNYMTLRYFENTELGEHYIERIDYTGNDAAGLAPYNRVEFDYEPRRDIKDSYISGSRVRIAKRLARVRSFAGDEPGRSYEIFYHYSRSSFRSRVSSVQECGSDGSCLRPTAFGWRQQVFGYERAAGFEDAPLALFADGANEGGTRVLDLDGDGKDDLLVARQRKSRVVAAYLNRGTRFERAPGFENFEGAFSSSSPELKVAELNGDTLPDLLLSRGSLRRAYVNTGASFQRAAQFEQFDIAFAIDGDDKGVRLVDLNGDGRQDLLRVFAGSNGSARRAYLNQGDGFVPAPQYENLENGIGFNRGLELADLNGDGLTDLLYAFGKDKGIARRAYLNTGSGWLRAPAFEAFTGLLNNNGTDGGLRILDINGDGNDDLIGEEGAFINTGAGFLFDDSFPALRFVRNPGQTGADTGYRLGEVNGDGLPDLINKSITVTITGSKNPGISFFVAAGREFGRTPASFAGVFTALDGMNTGESIFPERHIPFSKPPDYIPQYTDGAFSFVEEVEPDVFVSRDLGGRLADLNGDGLDDFLSFGNQHPGFSGRFARAYLAGQQRDLIATITNSFGLETRIDYGCISSPALYTKGRGAEFPVVDVNGPLWVVGAVETSDGVGGFNRSSYRYAGMRVHAQGLGNLGFERVVTTDETSKRVRIEVFSQDFEGRLQGTTRSVTEQFEGDYVGADEYTRLTRNQYEVTRRFGDRVFQHDLVRVDTIQRDLNRRFLGRTVTVTGYDQFGNATEVRNKVLDDADTLLNRRVSQTQYRNARGPWLIGQPERVETTASGPGQTAITTTTTARFDSKGRVIFEVVEPGDASLSVRRDYLLDSFGNRIRTTLSGSSFAKRSTEFEFDTTGRFVVGVTNALGQTTRREFEPVHGKEALVEGPNGLRTIKEYDGYGRYVRGARPDGTLTTVNYVGPAFCPAGAAYTKVTEVEQGPVEAECVDILGRVVRTVVSNLGGSVSAVDSVHDARGRVVRRSEPFVPGDEPLWNTTEYDDLDRPVVLTAADGFVGRIEYDGLRQVTRNRLGFATTTYRNPLGQLVQVVDALGNTLDYRYDALDRVLGITDPDGNVTESAYDRLGRRVAMSTPDKGDWSYRYDALGQLLEQVDAKGQVTVVKYDLLGRQIERTDDLGGPQEATQTWVYDSADNGIGLMAEMRSADFRERYEYDALSRRTLRGTTIRDEPEYQVRTSYDPFSRPSVVAYPNGLRIRNVYDRRGFLTQVRDADRNDLYAHFVTADARGNIVETRLGNGVTTLHDFEAETGFLASIRSSRAGAPPFDVQELDFEFDTLGNLLRRRDAGQDVEETFEYDPLNRLVNTRTALSRAEVSETPVQYDALGNITSRAGTGLYEYGTTCNGIAGGPHAVGEVTGRRSASYCYDENGNMVSGAGRTISYSPFDKPTRLENDRVAVSFAYDPNRQRFERIDLSQGELRTTHYVGGIYEKVWTEGKVEHRNFVGDFAIVTQTELERDGAVEEEETLRYLHRDHLGSLSAITDEDGQVEERFSFDSWGERRDIDWRDSDEVEELASAVTTRGFTDQEQIDSLGLVHMNGRVYDPMIGRFISADPFVQFPNNLQSYNRYSYVLNNPLSLTDPSGYFSLGKALGSAAKAIRRVVKSAARQIGSAVRSVGRAFVKYKALQVACVAATAGGCAPYVVAANAYAAYRAGATTKQIIEGAGLEAIQLAAGQIAGSPPGEYALKDLAFDIGKGLVRKAQGGRFGVNPFRGVFRKEAIIGRLAGFAINLPTIIAETQRAAFRDAVAYVDLPEVPAGFPVTQDEINAVTVLGILAREFARGRRAVDGGPRLGYDPHCKAACEASRVDPGLTEYLLELFERFQSLSKDSPDDPDVRRALREHPANTPRGREVRRRVDDSADDRIQNARGLRAGSDPTINCVQACPVRPVNPLFR